LRFPGLGADPLGRFVPIEVDCDSDETAEPRASNLADWVKLQRTDLSLSMWASLAALECTIARASGVESIHADLLDIFGPDLTARFAIEALLEIVERATAIDPADAAACHHIKADYEIAWYGDAGAPDPHFIAASALCNIEFLTRDCQGFEETRAVLDQLKNGSTMSREQLAARMHTALEAVRRR
jgi:hypothetical protein